MRLLFIHILLWLTGWMIAPVPAEGQSGNLSEKPIILTGQATDEHGLPVEAGNVLLLSVTDSSLIRGSFFTGGKFSFAAPRRPGSALLKLTALGYRDYYRVLQIPDQESVDSIALGPATLQLDELQGVEVVAGRQLVTTRGTDLVINVANTALWRCRKCPGRPPQCPQSHL